MRLFAELKRRNVFRVAIAYVVVAWLLAQVADLMLDTFGAPGWVMKTFLGFLVIGFPLALFFAWAFELTPEGIKKEKEVDPARSVTRQTARKLDRAIIVVLLIALAWFAWDKFGTGRPNPEAGASAAAPMTAKHANGDNPSGPSANSVAVLPFLALSSGKDDDYFADGLTEEILNSLAQLPELLVTARTSAFHFKGKDVPIPEIAKTLGVRNIVEGSVRRSGDRLRVTAQLVRADDGFHLWSEDYDSTAKDSIAVQEDIAEKIARALDIVMNDDKREAMRRAGLRDVEAFIAFQKGLDLYARAHDDNDQVPKLREANRYFETVIQRVPGYAPAYLAHSDLYIHQVFNHASGSPSSKITEQEAQAALQHAIADYKAAVANAATDEQRAAAQLDLAFVSGNWRALPRVVDQLLDAGGCESHSNWVSIIAPIFGYADRFLAKAHQQRVCDPLGSIFWFAEARATLWSGDADKALAIALQGSDKAPGTWLDLTVVWSAAAKSDFATAEAEAKRRVHAGSVLDPYVQAMISAARGEAKQAAVWRDTYRQHPDAEPFNSLQVAAWTGDRQRADALAAKIDQRPSGPNALLVVAIWCACGSPWDLSATPVFAEKIAQSGLPWPPPSPIRFPLKDW